MEGENRDDATSGDARTVRDEYVRKNGDLFREILQRREQGEVTKEMLPCVGHN